jgi:serine/threonine protein kinase
VLFPGQVLDDRYEILALLAEGGMGAVYRARRILLGDEVAIKIVRGDHAGSGPRERFFRESRASARLRHPQIVSILDFNVDDEQHPFLVMELLSGPSVKDEIVSHGRLTVAQVQQIVPPVCAALQFAHDMGIVHRDLKPANIVAHEFEPGHRTYKLVDFGIANLRETDETRLTGPHEFLGTLLYAAPEQLTGAQADARSDVYSMGAVVFEMVTGRPPFAGPDPMVIVSAHLNAPRPRISDSVGDAPAWLEIVVGRALAKSPADRWQTIADFGHALQAGDGGSTTVARQTPQPGGLLATYELGERIGPGRLGSIVYKGTHRALGHPVAIRLLRRDAEQNWAGARARFMREAQTLQVAHPSIIQVRDFGEEPDFVYLVTDYIEGKSLREMMTIAGPMSWPRLERLLAQLVEATRMLHRRKGLLCGVSPDIMRVTADDEGERLLISSAGVWQAQDLLATLQDRTLRGIALDDTELKYTAPEILIGRNADVRSDVFTMGVLAYEMATATLPYEGASMPELLGSMLRGEPADPRLLQPTLPDASIAAILRALRPSSGQRYASAAEFGRELLG